VATVVTRCQDNSASFDVRLQCIARADAKPAAKRTGENNLPLGGYFSLHGKTLLPDLVPDSQGAKATHKVYSVSRTLTGCRTCSPSTSALQPLQSIDSATEVTLDSGLVAKNYVQSIAIRNHVSSEHGFSNFPSSPRGEVADFGANCASPKHR
jgi:hypothetical protein